MTGESVVLSRESNPDVGRSTLSSAHQEAFRKIFEQHNRYVWNTLRYLGVRRSDLPDVVQEVFITVLKRMDEYEEKGSLRAWLFVIAANTANNYGRLARHRREVRDSEPLARAAQQADAEEHLALREQSAMLMAVLERIEWDKRVVLIMHDMDGIPAPQIAEHLGIPLNTVYSRIRLGRKDLRREVDQHKELAGGGR